MSILARLKAWWCRPMPPMTPERERRIRVRIDAAAVGKETLLVLVGPGGARWAVKATPLPADGLSVGYGEVCKVWVEVDDGGGAA